MTTPSPWRPGPKTTSRPAKFRAAATLTALVLLAGSCTQGGGGKPLASVNVESGSPGRQVPASFLGFGFEYDDILNFTGHGSAPDPELIRLLRQLARPDAGPLSIRVGGNSTDDSLWDPEQSAAPPGVGYTFGQEWLDSVSALARALDTRVILGVNLRVNDASAAARWAAAAQAAFDHPVVFEVGNEPNYYAEPRRIRPAGYSLDDYAREYSSHVRAIRSKLGPNARFAGPAVLSAPWMAGLGRFLDNESGLIDAVTYHQYPLSVCGKKPGSPDYPTTSQLLSDSATHGVASEARPFAAQAHSAGLSFRVDEVNSVVCLGADGVSNTFASALWLVDLLFEYVAAGVDGVNLQTITRAHYTPFRPDVSGWDVRPEFQALQLIVEAFAGRASLLPVTVKADGNVKAWATLDHDGVIRVVVVDKESRGGRVTIAIPGRRAAGRLVRLDGATPAARQAVLTSRSTISPERGIYAIDFNHAGAALLTVPD